jgi:signal transduction histidine kinase/ActR/RegA family two-component response regulator
VIITAEVARRAPRSADFAAENAALVALAQALTGPDKVLLQLLADTALGLCQAHSAGISLIETDAAGNSLFRWVATAGLCAPYIGGSTSLVQSPCGITAALGEPQLFAYPQRYFSELAGPSPEIVEGLVAVIPFEAAPHGTIWVMSHDAERQFDHEDRRVLTNLASFAGAALTLLHARREATAEALRTERVREALEQAELRREEFIAMLGHELRNPMSPIDSAIAVAKRLCTGNQATLNVLSIAQRQMRHLRALVDDLLDAARVRQGKLAIVRAEASLNEIVFDAVSAIQHHIDARRHTLVVQGMEASIHVFADHVRMSQMIGNLLSNAAKYTPAGGRIELVIEVQPLPTVVVTDAAPQGAQVDGDVLIRVRDNGVGISAELLPHVFELFAQAPSSNARAEGGLGIGLAVVKRMVDLHGGTIVIDSAGSGLGTAVTLRLPILRKLPVPDKPVGAPAATGSTPARILLVDDNPDALESLAMLLELEGHEVKTADSGKAALDIAQAFIPEVALIDIGMPEIDGFQLARMLRARPELDVTVLVALTGYASESDKSRALAAGFDLHLTKPLSLEKFQALLERRNGHSIQGLV